MSAVAPSPAARFDRAALAVGALQIASALTLALPLALIYARAFADVVVCLVASFFLLRSALMRDWSFLRRPWLRVALLFWGWLVVCTIAFGSTHATLEALAAARLFVFAAALENWVLPEPPMRRRLLWVIALTAAWIALECWQQYILGRNIAGYPRWDDGALTGPFRKPRAGGTFLVLFFPAVLPLVAQLLESGRSIARLGGAVLLAGAAATMVLIGQRMPVLLMGLGLAVSGLFLRRVRLPIAAALLVAASVLALTPVISPPTFHKLVLHFVEQMRDFATSNYGLLYVRGTILVQAHPWTGFGFDGFRENCADPAYFRGLPWLGVSDEASGELAGCNIHPHNYYMEAATSAGVPGLLLFAALVATLLARLWPGSSPAPLRVALFAFAAAMFWPFASTSELFTIENAGWLFLMLGWGLAEAAATGASRKAASPALNPLSPAAETPAGFALARPMNEAP